MRPVHMSSSVFLCDFTGAGGSFLFPADLPEGQQTPTGQTGNGKRA